MADTNVTLPITGMTCANCALNIERVVKKLPGVKDSSVNFASEQAAISFDPGQIQIQDLVSGIHDAGYGVPETRVEFPVTGMSCANCAMAIERTLKKKVPGVVQASVNFAAEHVLVEYIPNVTNVDEMIEAIERAGYGAIRPEALEEDEDAELAARRA